MEEYIYPFQDVSNSNVDISIECLSFHFFGALHFSTANINLPNRSNNLLDVVGEQIN